MDNNDGSAVACDKLDRVASWFSNNVTSTFFASLERYSCINLSTTDNDEDDNDAHIGSEIDDKPFLAHMFFTPVYDFHSVNLE
ncbi:hypothetical protein QN277_020238 [Acacia crassicarpa]|uniref:Uncharacterized protein n=1 Tax=Acacia crassicarpa TaxID=499986 RepID=A0AAE1JMK7_9FABA|nr:hypothetical protein QN277_020238 [Acacia crassicarpa]